MLNEQHDCEILCCSIRQDWSGATTASMILLTGLGIIFWVEMLRPGKRIPSSLPVPAAGLGFAEIRCTLDSIDGLAALGWDSHPVLPAADADT